MLRTALAAAAFAAVAAAALGSGGCAARAVPYSFASPMIGGADVPPPALPRPAAGRPASAHDDDVATIDVRPTYVPPASGSSGASGASAAGTAGRSADTLPPEDHVRSISMSPPTLASAASADAVVRDSTAHGLSFTQLPAPHRATSPLAPVSPGDLGRAPDLARPTDLRKLVGHRDGRNPISLAIWWANALGKHISAADGPTLVATAASAGTLRPPSDDPNPGDLLVFDHVESDAPADCVAIAIARDDRNVTEFIYLSGGVVRRGFVDTRHASHRRDPAGDILNTFMRTGRRWPPKGTHYLAGELLSHIIRAR